MSELMWTHFAEVRFDDQGRMLVRAKQGSYWVKTVKGIDVPQDELILHPRRRHDDG